ARPRRAARARTHFRGHRGGRRARRASRRGGPSGRRRAPAGTGSGALARARPRGDRFMNTMLDAAPNVAERDFSGVDRARVIAALSPLLPPGGLIYDTEDVRPYECDGLTAIRQLPMVVALPETEAQVVDVLRTCRELGVPVVARGAGTGLSGGALPHAHGVLLSLAKFNRILAIDRLARTADVQPG